VGRLSFGTLTTREERLRWVTDTGTPSAIAAQFSSLVPIRVRVRVNVGDRVRVRVRVRV